jgi:alpha-galactosidase
LFSPANVAEASSTHATELALKWTTADLEFEFSVVAGRLRQHLFLPASFDISAVKNYKSNGVETGLLCSGENSPDPGMKQSGGSPGHRLTFIDKREVKTSRGERLVIEHHDAELGLRVESHYEGFDGLPVVRRHVSVTNLGNKPVGIDYLSSAMLHGLADPDVFEEELKIWVAYNSWMAEGQWHSLRPSEMGFVENGRTSWSEASAGSIGSWSSEKYLPMAVIENSHLGVAWFWQIEHNGSWYWEVSNVGERGNIAGDVYAYLGGPDQLHAQAWKNLKPGESYQTVPVAIGCVRGGFGEAVRALTEYRRQICQGSRQSGLGVCPVMFNDYMNCLWGDPTEEKELPLIDAAAAAGCEYFVIDAGWYAERNEDWSGTLGSWQPTKTRWPHGIRYVLDRIREKGMIPGLWLEPEVAGMHSTLSQKPDDWFFVRHGYRVEKNSRLLLDFRNPQVLIYLNDVIERLVKQYGVGYIKMDYNTDSLEGTDRYADSFGQGLLEHNRALLGWLDGIRERYPALILENCGSGGGRMDYAMLSRMQLQSCTDQEEYLRLPAIVAGASAAVIPMQLAVWSYPRKGADADQASFNMVTAMLCRIHQSGDLASLLPEAAAYVREGIRIYRDVIRQNISAAVPFYPLGMPNVTNAQLPVALGIQSGKQAFIAVWRIEGLSTIQIPVKGKNIELLYPSNLGIEIRHNDEGVLVMFPRRKMACILVVTENV